MIRISMMAALIAINATGVAIAAEPIALTLKNHKFTPSEFSVPPATKFQIKLTNNDDTPAEFESHDLKFEKIVVPGGTITVTAGPLKPGTYKFFDEYNPDEAWGTVTVKE